MKLYIELVGVSILVVVFEGWKTLCYSCRLNKNFCVYFAYTLNLATFLQDILHTQEQNLALQHELMEYKKNTDEQLQYLKVNAILT